MKIAILGANSHIAAGLIYKYSQYNENELFLFSTNTNKLSKYIYKTYSEDIRAVPIHYKYFNTFNYDIIINCVGTGTHVKDYSDYFTISEKYDNLCIEYLKNNIETFYFSFSSGAVYTNIKRGISEYNTNRIEKEQYYSISCLYKEAKHRSFKDLKIIDLRIFSYFSRFANLKDNYFLIDIINCIKETKVLETTDEHFSRDYITFEDIYQAIDSCLKLEKNNVYELCSLQYSTKKEILNFFEREYNLKIKIINLLNSSSTGSKFNYFAHNTKANLLDYTSQTTSLQNIENEVKYILGEFKN